MKKKLLVMLLSFVMVVTMMPLSVFASTANSEKGDNNEYTVTVQSNDSSLGTVKFLERTKDMESSVRLIGKDKRYRQNEQGQLVVEDNMHTFFAIATPADGCKFVDWSPAIGEGGDITEDMTFTANFEKEAPVKTWEVTFDSRGGTDVETQIVEDGKYAVEPAAPSKIGCTFYGWFSIQAGKPTQFDFSNTPIKEDIELYARWAEKPVITNIVTFDSQGGTHVVSQIVENGKYATEPANPTKEGATFNGWFTEPEGAGTAFDFENTPITSNITLYADWIEQPTTEYTITKTTTPGVADVSVQVEGTEVSEAAAGATVQVTATPDASHEIGYMIISFDDKTIDPVLVKGDKTTFTMPASNTDVAVYAIDPTVERTVTVESTPQEGGYVSDWATGEEVTEVTVPDGTPYGVTEDGHFGIGKQYLSQSANEGYEFVGWEPSEDSIVTSDMTVKAKFEKTHVIPQVTGLKAKATDSKTASLAWKQIIGHYGIKYEVWRSAGTSGDFKKVATTASNSYKDRKVITGTKYTYKVRAVCEGQTGEFSDTDYAYPRLFKVINFSAKALSAAKVQISWNANGNKNVVYQVYRSTQSNTGFKRVATITDGKTTYSQTFTPTQSGMKYYYKVRAITKDYTGKWHYGTFSKVDYAYPRVVTPTGFKAWASGKHTCNCSWNKVAGSKVKYLVYRGTKPTGNWGKAIATTTKTSYTNKNMKSGKKYYYMVRAVQTINGKKYYSNYSAKDYAYPR